MRKVLLGLTDLVQIVFLFATIAMGFSIFIDHTVSYKSVRENTLIQEKTLSNQNLNEMSLGNVIPLSYSSENIVKAESVSNTAASEISSETPVENTVNQQPKLLSEEERYNYLGIKYDQQYPINISFFTDITDEPIPVIFNPLIPTNEIPKSVFEAGSGYTMVYADPLGNVSVIPHSGFYITHLTDGTYIETRYEADRLREYIEGGNSQDTIYGFEEYEVRRRIESIKYATMSQNDVTVPMRIISVAIISADRLPEKPTVEPQGIASLIGVTLDKPSIVIVTCAWRWDTDFIYLDDSYASNERIIIILQPQT